MNVLKRIGGAILGVIIVALVIGFLFPDANDAWAGVALVVGAIFGALFPKVTLFIPILLFIIIRKLCQPPEKDPEKEAITNGYSGRIKKK